MSIDWETIHRLWAAELPAHLDEGERFELARLMGEKVRQAYGSGRHYVGKRYRESESPPEPED
jgi:hypothetical protein